MLTVIGRDGSPLPAEARELLASAALVAGDARLLEDVTTRAGARIVTSSADVLAAVDEALSQGEQAVVVVDGDPGFFGTVRALREHGHAPYVLPGLSPVARAFARAGLPWDDAVVVSVGGGDGFRRAVNACRAHPKVAVLTAPGAGPAELGRDLFPQTPRSFIVCEDLGGPRERVVHARPAEATTRPWRDPQVVLVLDRRRVLGDAPWNAGPAPGPAGWALPDTAFQDGAAARQDVRAFALAKLGPRLGDMVWDVGSRGGSVAIEAARLGAASIAVDRDTAACERVRVNVRAHGVKVAVSRGEAPDVLDHLPIPDAVFVGRGVAGGRNEVVRACAVRALRSVVVELDDEAHVRPACESLAAEGFTTEAVRLQAEKLWPPTPTDTRSAPSASVSIVWGERGVPADERPQAGTQRRARTIAELPAVPGGDE